MMMVMVMMMMAVTVMVCRGCGADGGRAGSVAVRRGNVSVARKTTGDYSA